MTTRLRAEMRAMTTRLRAEMRAMTTRLRAEMRWQFRWLMLWIWSAALVILVAIFSRT